MVKRLWNTETASRVTLPESGTSRKNTLSRTVSLIKELGGNYVDSMH